MKDLAMHILDITRNSVEAKAHRVTVAFALEKTDQTLTVRIGDDGCGMDADMVKRVTDPFTTTRTTRKVGMGLPLFKMSVEQTGGALTINSQLGKGTEVLAWFKTSHIDCVPMGDMAGTTALLMTGHPDLDFHFDFSVNGEHFGISTPSVREIMGDVGFNHPSVVRFLKDMVRESLQEIGFEY